MKEFELPDDEEFGFVQVKICGVTLRVDPSDELQRMNGLARTPEESSGQAFVNLLRTYLGEKLRPADAEAAAAGGGAPPHVSSALAWKYYTTVRDAEKEVNAFFSETGESQTSPGSSAATA